jgi:hypothetical protein
LNLSNLRPLCITVILVLVAFPLGAAPPATQSTAQTGTFTAKFTDRSSMSGSNELSRRFGEKQVVPDYDLSQHEFIVHVPPDYDPAKPMGVMFLLLYKDTSEPPTPCLPMLAQKRLIFIVPKNHDVMPPAMRCGIVLDAVYDLKKRYAIDDKRIFLFATYVKDDFTNQRIALACGDVFTGLFVSEPGFYKPLPAKKAHSFYQPNFSAPPSEVLGKAKQRPLILCKEHPDDYSAAVAKGFQSDGFKRVKTMEPDHEALHYPNLDPKFIGEAIEFMDTLSAKPQAGATTRAK